MLHHCRSLAALIAVVLLATLAPAILRPAVADAQAPAVIINEFLAINQDTLADNTGAFEDWIELRNTSGSTVSLAGWTLTDNADAFVFPAGTTIGANSYLVIWASGDVTRTTPTQIHLPFKLSGSGEPLTLTDATGVLSQPGWPAPATYPVQIDNDSYGVASNGQIRYFTDPTPGAANGTGVGGLVEPVTFSVAHGFYTTAQTIVLNSPTPNATIRYTTNGDVPTANSGTPITPGTAITVNSTTVIRAVAHRDGWITSPVESRSYLFTADIVNQGQPAGWPGGPVNEQVFDYEMDPNVVNGNNSAVQASLTSIPTISIVTDLDNLVDPATGIYVNPRERGAEWERQAAIELIDPTGGQAGFDIEGGLRIRGGFSRNPANAKHALRLYFRNEYEGQLDYPLFGNDGTDSYEVLGLRTASNYSWNYFGSSTASFIDEVWSRDTQAAMGNPHTRSQQVHLYINGVYWGLYMTQERVSGEYGESYFGGNEDDYDVVKRGGPGIETEATDGTYAAWASLHPLVSDMQVTAAEYTTIANQVDLVSLADYYLLHFWSGDFDGSPSYFTFNGGDRWRVSNNWFAIRNRNGAGTAGKWQFFDHDSEHSLCATGAGQDETIDNTPPWNAFSPNDAAYLAPGWLHEALITNDAYRQIFIDRVQLHVLTPGGALTVPEGLARLNARANEVAPAVLAESARWGDNGGATTYGVSTWQAAVQLKRDCLGLRAGIVEQQLRADGLWPNTAPPVIAPAGGGIAYGENVTISASGGQLYFTTDGSDPRNPNGAVAPTAQAYSGPITITSDVTIRARVLELGQWTPEASQSYFLTTTAGPVSVALNEFNAVSGSRFLGGGTVVDVVNGTDATFGRVAGNGGDWMEFVVIEDGTDMRGWTFEVWNDNVAGVLELDATLTLSNDPVFSDMHDGSILTISEDIADDISYNPRTGDWHLNVQSNNAFAGSYITTATQSNFSINNDDTQVAIFDSTGAPVQLRTGEGTVDGVSVSSSEVFKLEGTPTTSITSGSILYNDGTSSTWGLPNVFSSGTATQELGRVTYGDINCDNALSVADAVVIAQSIVGLRTDQVACSSSFDPTSDVYIRAADVNGDDRVTIADAVLISQCISSLQNVFCPDGLP